jgi:hypothetical protein
LGVEKEGSVQEKSLSRARSFPLVGLRKTDMSAERVGETGKTKDNMDDQRRVLERIPIHRERWHEHHGW